MAQMGKSLLDWKDKEWVYEQWCNGYTQAEIADAIGCNPKTIQRFLCKKQKIKKPLVYERKEKGEKTMTIYDIEQEIMDCIDQETGEVIDIDRLNALEMERDKKISNVACWIKDLKAEAEAIKAEKQALDKRQKAAENKAERLKEWLQGILQGEKFKDSRCAISYRKSERVDFADSFDYNTLPDYMKKVTIEPKKTEIKDYLKTGATIEGVELVESSNIQIR